MDEDYSNNFSFFFIYVRITNYMLVCSLLYHTQRLTENLQRVLFQTLANSLLEKLNFTWKTVPEKAQQAFSYNKTESFARSRAAVPRVVYTFPSRILETCGIYLNPECTRKNATGEWWPIREFYRGAKETGEKFLVVELHSRLTLFLIHQNVTITRVISTRRKIHLHYEFTLESASRVQSCFAGEQKDANKKHGLIVDHPESFELRSRICDECYKCVCAVQTYTHNI